MVVCELVGNDQLWGKGFQCFVGFIWQVGVGYDIG